MEKHWENFSVSGRKIVCQNVSGAHVNGENSSFVLNGKKVFIKQQQHKTYQNIEKHKEKHKKKTRIFLWLADCE